MISLATLRMGRSALGESGLSVSIGSVHSFPIHTHAYFELILYHPFQGQVRVNDTILQPTQSFAVLMTPADLHGVEVTGKSAAMKQALECASWQGRISLLGCTRVSDCPVDYYQQVHRPGVKLIGAHNFVRPKVESHPHHWTHHDDCKAILDLIGAGRIQVEPIVSRVVSPEDCTEIYNQLCDDPTFPMGTVFDWTTE